MPDPRTAPMLRIAAGTSPAATLDDRRIPAPVDPTDDPLLEQGRAVHVVERPREVPDVLTLLNRATRQNQELVAQNGRLRADVARLEILAARTHELDRISARHYHSPPPLPAQPPVQPPRNRFRTITNRQIADARPVLWLIAGAALAAAGFLAAFLIA